MEKLTPRQAYALYFQVSSWAEHHGAVSFSIRHSTRNNLVIVSLTYIDDSVTTKSFASADNAIKDIGKIMQEYESLMNS